MTYPQSPGYKGTVETGRQAAEAFAPKLPRRQAEVLRALADGPATAEEIADRIGRHWYLVRPRVSELKARGLVMDTGERRPAALGGKTYEVRLTTEEERAEILADRAAEAEGAR